jgi:hypothetical protein
MLPILRPGYARLAFGTVLAGSSGARSSRSTMSSWSIVMRASVREPATARSRR